MENQQPSKFDILLDSIKDRDRKWHDFFTHSKEYYVILSVPVTDEQYTKILLLNERGYRFRFF